MKKIYIFFIIALICGFIQINFLETQFETKYFNVEDVKIKAIVISDLREKEYKYSCTIKVQEINGNKEYKDTKLILNLKKSIVVFLLALLLQSTTCVIKCPPHSIRLKTVYRSILK